MGTGEGVRKLLRTQEKLLPEESRWMDNISQLSLSVLITLTYVSKKKKKKSLQVVTYSKVLSSTAIYAVMPAFQEAAWSKSQWKAFLSFRK